MCPIIMLDVIFIRCIRFQKIAEISLHVVYENQDRALTPFSEGRKRLLNGFGVASAEINIFNLSSNGNVHLSAFFVILKVRFFALNKIRHNARTTLNWMFCLSLQLARLLQVK